MKIKGKATASEKKLLARIEREMDEPRLAESVREAGERPAPPASTKPGSTAG
jgi:hypothetical protein